MIIGLQIVAILFSLMMVYLALLHYKRRELNSVEILSWVIIWICTIFAIIFPEILRTFALTFAISRVFDLMVVGGLILAIYVASASYIRTRHIEKKFEEFVRKEAKNRVRVPKRK
ncbi:DUF2304 domain-containing protein [Patescibacteria group bacterium]|nr:DUF2304 domain-containing protein [Patescibacteria group bacterium]